MNAKRIAALIVRLNYVVEQAEKCNERGEHLVGNCDNYPAAVGALGYGLSRLIKDVKEVTDTLTTLEA